MTKIHTLVTSVEEESYLDSLKNILEQKNLRWESLEKSDSAPPGQFNICLMSAKFLSGLLEFDQFLKTKKGSLFVLYKDASELKFLGATGNDYIDGFIQIEQPALTYYPLLSSTLKRNELFGPVGNIDRVYENIKKVIDLAGYELQRAKKLHEQLVPIRHEKLQGLSLSSKFAAGLGPGGEFFDFVKKDHQLCLIVASSKSYIASSVVLTHFEKFQRTFGGDQESLEDFMEELIDECRSLDLIDRDQPELLQFAIIMFDINRMSYLAYQFGNFAIKSNKEMTIPPNQYPFHESFFEKAQYSGKLERGEKVILLSPGCVSNFDDKLSRMEIQALIGQNLEKEARNAINEVFFQLKRGLAGDFLKRDASVVFIEVDKNAILQV
jgi:hypothetical protein